MIVAQPTRTRRTRRVLDLFFIGAYPLAALQLASLPAAGGGMWRIGIGVPILLAVLGSWFLVRRGPGERFAPGATMLLMLLAAALPFLVDGAASWPMYLLGLVVFLPVWGVTAGIGITGALGVLQFVIFLVGDRGLAEATVESTASMMILGSGLAAAWLVAEHDRQRQEIAELLVERERGFERESDLMLARERTRAARDLHDGLGHRLTLISMSLQFAREARRRQPERAWEQIDQAQSQSRDALEHMRRWVRALTPPTEASDDPIEQIAATFRSTGLDVRVESGADGVADDPSQRLYERRMVQEGLTNSLRHSESTLVRIIRTVDADGMRIVLRDDSRGPESDTAAAESITTVEEGFGLRSLRERAEELDGSFRAGRVADGFLIEARLPPASDGPDSRSRAANRIGAA